MTLVSNPNTPSESRILIPTPLSSYFFLLQGGGEGGKFLGGDRAGGDDEGGGELEGRNPPNPSEPIGALPLLDVLGGVELGDYGEFGGCEGGGV